MTDKPMTEREVADIITALEEAGLEEVWARPDGPQPPSRHDQAMV